MLGQTVGNLRILSEIGRGGMGVVYLAEHLSLKKKFAIKCLSLTLTNDPQFRKRFYDEALNQAKLDHPNIVKATDFFESEEQFIFVMEYVDGQDLGAIIEEKGPLPEKLALKIFKDVLEALKYAHSKNLIHRDVKPQNILIDEGNRARLMDFGIAVMFGRERLTATGTAVGSPWYMSPEQITNPTNLDKRSDVYAAGIVLYEMLTGDVPFDGKSDFAVKDQQVNIRPEDPHQRNSSIDNELSSIILKALNKNPDHRFQGCHEFLQSIKEYESNRIKLPGGSLKKQSWMLFIAIAIVSAGVSIYIINFWDKDIDGQPHSKPPAIELKQEPKSAPTSSTKPQQPKTIISPEPKKTQPDIKPVPPKPKPLPSTKTQEPKIRPKQDTQKPQVTIPKPEPKIVVPPAMPDQSVQHENANLLIETAVDKVAFICRETRTLGLKRKNMEIAMSMGYDSMANKYKKNINEIEGNIQDAISHYVDFIEKLNALPTFVVEKEFAILTQIPEVQHYRVRLRVVNGHYSHYQARGMPSDTILVQQLCAVE